MTLSYGALPTGFASDSLPAPAPGDASSRTKKGGSSYILVAAAGLVSLVVCALLLSSGTASTSMRGAQILSLKTEADTTDADATTTYGGVTSAFATNSLGAGKWSALAGSSSLGTLFATDSSNGNFKASANGGTSFTTTTPFTYAYGGSTGVTPITQLATATDGSVVYAAGQWTNKYGGGLNSGNIYYSKNAGTSWTTINPAGASASTASYVCVATSSTGLYVLTADSYLTKKSYVSSNSGATWTAGATTTGTYLACAMSSSGQYMYAYMSNGVSVSRDFGVTWTLTTSAAGYGTVGSISASADGSKVFASTNYITPYACWYSSNYAASFSASTACLDTTYAATATITAGQAVVSPDGARIAVIQQNYQTANTYNLAYFSLRISADGGATWQSLTPSGGSVGDNFWFVSRLVSNADMSSLSVAVPTTSYNYMGYTTYPGYGQTVSLSYTTSAPTRLPTPSPSLPPSRAPTMAQMSAAQAVGTTNYWAKLAMPMNTLGVVYAISSLPTDSYVYKSSDNGVSWSKLTSSKNLAGNTALSCDLDSGKYVYTAYDRTSTSSSSSNAGITYSADYGATWTKVPLSCTTCQYYDIAVDLTGANVYAAGGIGTTVGGSGDLMMSSDYGRTYSSLGAAIGYPALYAVDVDFRNQNVFAASRAGYVYCYYVSSKKFVSYSPSGSFLGRAIPFSFVFIPAVSDSYSVFAGGLGGVYGTSGNGIWTLTNADETKDWRQMDGNNAGSAAIMVPSSGYFYTSANGGRDWTAQTAVGAQQFTSVAANSDLTSVTLATTGTTGGSLYHFGGFPTSSPANKPSYAPTAAPSCLLRCGYTHSGSYACLSFCSTNPTAASADEADTDADAAEALNPSGFFYFEASNASVTLNYEGLCVSDDGAQFVAASYGHHIYRSTDMGDTWGSISDTLNEQQWYAVSCSDDLKDIVAVTEDGSVFFSKSDGAKWALSTIDKDQFLDVKSSSDGNVVIVGGMNAVYLSTDNGATFATLNSSTGLKDTTYGYYAVSASADGSVLAACAYYAKCYLSTDSGASFAPTSLDAQEWAALAMSSDGSVIAAAANNGFLYVSTDGGDEWTATEAGVKTWTGIACSNDGSVIAATASDDYIMTSVDSGATWAASGDVESYTNIASSGDGQTLLAVGLNIPVYVGEYYVEEDARK